MLKIRRSRDRLIFNMGIPIHGKDGLYTETGPGSPWADITLKRAASLWLEVLMAVVLRNPNAPDHVKQYVWRPFVSVVMYVMFSWHVMLLMQAAGQRYHDSCKCPWCQLGTRPPATTVPALIIMPQQPWLFISHNMYIPRYSQRTNYFRQSLGINGFVYSGNTIWLENMEWFNSLTAEKCGTKITRTSNSLHRIVAC